MPDQNKQEDARAKKLGAPYKQRSYEHANAILPNPAELKLTHVDASVIARGRGDRSRSRQGKGKGSKGDAGASRPGRKGARQN